MLNKGPSGLYRRYLLLCILESKVLGFELVNRIYAKDEDFKESFAKFSNHAYGLFHLEGGFLFKGIYIFVK